ncbi:putative reverse transcriptase domain-containing protein [Tanacetum coccineum]
MLLLLLNRPSTIGTPMRRIRKLNEKMRERAEVNEQILKKIDKSDLHIRMWEAGVREQYLPKFRLGGGFVKTSTRSFLGPFPDDPYVQARNAAMADDDVEGDDVEDEDDMDDDAADPSDPQSSEPRGSPRDSYYNYTNGMITYSLLFLCRNRIMPPKQMSQAAIAKLVADEVAKALAADRATRNTTGTGGPGNVGGAEGAIELCRWFEKIESTFGISECAERNKVKFATTTLHEEFCPEEEISRMEDEMRNLRLKDHDIAGWNERNAEQNKRKWEGGNQGNRNNNRGGYRDNRRHNQNNNRRNGGAGAMTQAQNENVNLAGHAPKCDRCNMFHFGNCPMTCRNCGKRGHKAKNCHREGVAIGANTKPIKVCYKYGDPNHLANSDLCPERKKQVGRNISGHVYVVKEVYQAQGPNMVTGTILLNNRYFSMLFDSGSNKSFINASLTHLIDVEPERISTSYEVKLADGRIVSTNTVLKGCTLNLVNHLFKIDLMPIEFGTFDVIIGMDWLVTLNAIIICGKKEVHILVKNQTLVVKGDSNSSRLKVISCIKARKYIERGCHLLLAHVTEKVKSEKRLEDVPVIHDFPKVFPDDLLGLPPP